MATKKDNTPEAEQVQQNQGGQYVPPQQYAQAPQPKKSSNAVLVVVIVVVVFFGILPAIALFFLGGVLRDFFSSPDGHELVQTVINKIDPEINRGEYVVGEWDCKPYSGSSSISSESYTSSLILRNNGTFQYGKYGDLENNSFYGKFRAEKEDKDHPTYNYYMLKFSSVSKKVEGEQVETGGLQNLEMGITKTGSGREAVAMFADYNMYYCYER